MPILSSFLPSALSPTPTPYQILHLFVHKHSDHSVQELGQKMMVAWISMAAVEGVKSGLIWEYILKLGPVRFYDRFDVEYEKEESRMTSHFSPEQ